MIITQWNHTQPGLHYLRFWMSTPTYYRSGIEDKMYLHNGAVFESQKSGYYSNSQTNFSLEFILE